MKETVMKRSWKQKWTAISVIDQYWSIRYEAMEATLVNIGFLKVTNIAYGIGYHVVLYLKMTDTEPQPKFRSSLVSTISIFLKIA